MPITAFLHTHVLVVILFLIMFIIKAFLLFTNKTQALESIKRKTKVLDIILGVLILVTGGFLLFQYTGIPTWLITKVVLVLAAIPLAIIGFKKLNKPMVGLSLIIFIYTYGVAESKSLSMQKKSTELVSDKAPVADPAVEEDTLPTGENAPAINTEMSETAIANARQIYNNQCTACHGEDGRKKLNNATDFTKSLQTMEERKNVILNGRGLMPGFRGQVSEQEAEELAAYTQMLGE